MACGSCGQKYRRNSFLAFTGNYKGTRKGVIKKSQFGSTSSKKEETSPPSPLSTPVDGNSGPSVKPE